MRALAATHRVIAYDQRGHGRSPAARAHSTTALADDLVAVLGATLAPGERAVVAGHSMGGMTIMAAAGRPEFTEHAAAALLCSTGSSRLVAEAQVLPVRAGRARTRVTGAVLGSRAPSGRSRPSPGRSSSTPRWAPVPPPTRWRRAPVSSTPVPPGCGTPGPGCWPGWTSTPRWPSSPCPPPSSAAPPTGSPRSCTPAGSPPRCRTAWASPSSPAWGT
ncbi:alpha/beta fold hydrolase [Streptomyces sp. NPDC001586]|uniref:alpha/beta hydrolase n=1 Tax=Streptomyces sp. NPDC001586 TaxID=3154387 RepID=UPI003318D57E